MNLRPSLKLFKKETCSGLIGCLSLLFFAISLPAQLTWDGTTFLNEEQTYDGLGADADRDPLTLTSGDFNIARGAGEVGILNVVGGTLTLNNEGTWDSKVAFADATGELNISGGATVNLILSGTSEQRFRVSHNGGSTGTINLDGGDLNVSFGHDDQTHGDRGLWFGTGGGVAIANLNSGTFTYSAPAATRIGTAGTGTINILDGAFVQTGSEQVSIGGSGRINFISGGSGYVSILGWEESDFEALVESGHITLDGSSAVTSVFLYSFEGGQGIYSLDPDAFEFLSDPEDQIVWAGTDVTFAATFFGPQATDFQWEVSTDNGGTWTPITGANSLSYSIQAPGTELDGNQYRVAATHGEQSIATQPATLRVGDAEVPESRGVVAYYRFEEGPDGGVVTGAIDSSGNGNHMNEVLGSPQYTTLRPTDPIPFSGEDNQYSLELFTNQEQYAVQGTDGDGLSQVVFDSITLEAWVNFNALPNHQTIIGRDDRGQQRAGNNALVYLQKAPAGFRVEIWGRSNNNLTVDTNVVPVAGEWYHVAAVGDIDAGTLTFYINGEPAGSRNDFDGVFIPPTTDTRWSIGRGQWGGDDSVGQSHGDWFNGRIDEVRISNAALRPEEFLNFNNAVFRFTEQPTSIAAAAGHDVTFTAVAAGGGTEEVTYQWQISENDGATWTDIGGATNNSYTVESVALDDDGKQFQVIATRGATTITSEVATLSVFGFPDPVVVQGLTGGQLALEGDPFTFTVEATSSAGGNITYQWQKDGEDLVGETNNTLHFESLARDDDGTYSVVITDDAATSEGLDPTTVTLSTILPVAPYVRSAVSLNFVGTGSSNWGSSPELGKIFPHEAAGVVPVLNWNNSAEVTEVSISPAPLVLVNDTGTPTQMTATWDSANTWSARSDAGAPQTKDVNSRLFHGFIERRAEDDGNPTTITIDNIPYSTYDVYVYPMSVEGDQGAFIRNVRMEDGNGEREFFMRNATGNPTPNPIPFVLSHATTLQEAIDSEPATYFRFAESTGSTVTIRHFDNNEHGWGWNSGGIAAISIVDTTASTPARPILTSRPSGGFVPSGTLTLSAAAESVNPGGSVSYQWQKDGANLSNGGRISGATGSTLTISDATSADNGIYTVVVTDSSDLPANSTARASTEVVVVDSARLALISADMTFRGGGPDDGDFNRSEEMHGHAILRTDGPITVNPAAGDSNPDQIGEGETIWNRVPYAHQGGVHTNLVDSEGLLLSGLTFTATGANGIEDNATSGGIDSPITDWSGPLLRDYIFTTDDNVMTLTLGGLQAFAGREVTLVVYAVGKEAIGWGDSQDDNATVTLVAANSPTGEAQSDVTVIDPGTGFEGRDLRYNNDAHVTFDAVIGANGTLTWTVGPVPGQPGLNAFNGFQVLMTDVGEAPPPPEGIANWLDSYFGPDWESNPDADLTADPDADGFKNLVEYALGTDPTVAGAAHGAINLGLDGDFLTLTFNHIDDPNLVYYIEAANNLNEGWNVVHTFPTFNAVGTATYTDNVAIGSNPTRFIRLSVRLLE